MTAIAKCLSASMIMAAALCAQAALGDAKDRPLSAAVVADVETCLPPGHIQMGGELGRRMTDCMDNLITGNALANVLSGGAGNDTLIGGAGNDRLDGGSGAEEQPLAGAHFDLQRCGAAEHGPRVPRPGQLLEAQQMARQVECRIDFS